MKRAAAALLLSAAPAAAQARVAYTLTLAPEPAPGRLVVDVRIEGAQEVGSLELQLSGFGGWPHAEHEHLTSLAAHPPLAPRGRGDTTLRFALPETWDGSARVAYVVPVLDAEAGKRHGLLPRRDGDLVAAIACNVLPNVLADGGWLDAERTLAVRAPDDLWIASGWADPIRGALDVAFPGSDQCPLYFHPRPCVAAAAGVQVVQVNDVEDTTAAVAELVRTTLEACAAATGVPRDGLQRVFVTGSERHVSGGMRTDRGVVLAWNPDIDDVTYRHMLAHELFHEWLPGRLSADGPELVWFFEGFTQYASLWIAARAGLVTPADFAQRLLDLDGSARRSAAHGAVAFGDPDVAWRDGGAVETYAYDGGAVLAFHVDVALRGHGRTLTGVLGEWMRGAVRGYSLDALHAELRRNDALALYGEHVAAAAELPSTADTLRDLGFDGDPVAVRRFLAAAVPSAGDGAPRVLGEDRRHPVAVAVSRRLKDFSPGRFGGEPHVLRDPRKEVTADPDAPGGYTLQAHAEEDGLRVSVFPTDSGHFSGNEVELFLGAGSGGAPVMHARHRGYSHLGPSHAEKPWTDDLAGVVELQAHAGRAPLRLRFLVAPPSGDVVRGEIELAWDPAWSGAWVRALERVHRLPAAADVRFERLVRADGTLLAEGQLDAHARRQGTWRSYDERGFLAQEHAWRDGLPHGTWRAFGRDGGKYREATFERGLRASDWNTWR